jgi:tripartite-type tricarboxylate transporter receptor subunit TctC
MVRPGKNRGETEMRTIVSVGRLAGAALLTAGLLASFGAALAAESWPTRTVTCIVPLGAGSGSDVMARIVLDKVSQQVGQTIIVENKPGAGGTIGTAFAIRAPADGYTMVAYGALASAQALYPKLSYDTLRDLTPVAALGQQPLVVIVKPDGPFKTLADLVAAIKAKPDTLNYASAGVGSTSHFGASRFLMTIGGKAQHIPYKGAADSVTELMAGRVDFSIQPLSVAVAQIRSGRLKALAVGQTTRSPSLPDVPTMIEAGVPADAIYPYYAGVFVSSKTPNEITQKLHDEIAKALSEPAVAQKLAAIGVEPMPMSQQQFKSFFEKDVANNIEIVKAANIKIQ